MEQYTTVQTLKYRGNGFMTTSKYSPDGKFIYITDQSSRAITCVDTSNYTIYDKYDYHDGVIWDIGLSDDGRILASCSGDFKICFLNTETGELIDTHTENAIPKIVRVSQSGLYFGVFCESLTKKTDSYVKIFSTDPNPNPNIQLLYTIPVEKSIESKISTIEWFDDNVLMLGWSTGYITLENIHTIGRIQIPSENSDKHKIHEKQINHIIWNSSHTQILTCSDDTYGKITNVYNWKSTCEFECKVPAICGFFSNKDRKVVIAGGINAMDVARTSNNDLSIKFFKTSNGQLTQTLTSHFGPVRYLGKCATNSNFVSASQDGSVKIYLMDGLDEEIISNELGMETNQMLNVNWKPSKKALEEENGSKQKNWVPGMGTISNTNNSLISANANTSIDLKNSLEQINQTLQEQNTSIRITNLPEYMSNKELYDMFDLYGRIEERGVRIIRYEESTIAFINYTFRDSAMKAIENCDGMPLDHRIIHVELAHKN